MLKDTSTPIPAEEDRKRLVEIVNVGLKEREVQTADDVRAVLAGISFGPSGVMLDKMEISWRVDEVREQFGDEVCVWWKVRFEFNRPDTLTAVLGRGSGRWEVIEKGAFESTVVKTAWLLLELLVRHELMESFHYRGVRIFDPHRTVAELAAPLHLEPPR